MAAPVLGFLIDIGALVALAAGILACLTAAARVLLLMAHNGLTHSSLRTTHARNETPTGAIIATGLAAFLPVALLAAKGTSGLDVYGWLGTLAVYGFVVSYGLVCFALPGYLRDHHGVVNLATKTIPWLAFIAMVLALVANLYPVPEGVYGKLPYIFLAYLAVVLLLFVFRSRAKNLHASETLERCAKFSHRPSSLFREILTVGKNLTRGQLSRAPLGAYHLPARRGPLRASIIQVGVKGPDPSTATS